MGLDPFEKLIWERMKYDDCNSMVALVDLTSSHRPKAGDF